MSDNKMTSGQEGDAAAVYLAEARTRAERELRYICVAPEGPAWSCEDVPRLLGAVEAVLSPHQEHEGRCITCLEPCRCAEDAYIAEGCPASLTEAQALRIATAWAACAHGNEPWPCKPYRDITAELTGKDGTE